MYESVNDLYASGVSAGPIGNLAQSSLQEAARAQSMRDQMVMRQTPQPIGAIAQQIQGMEAAIAKLGQTAEELSKLLAPVSRAVLVSADMGAAIGGVKSAENGRAPMVDKLEDLARQIERQDAMLRGVIGRLAL